MSMTDCTAGAVEYFTSLRTPAALIAGSALVALFACVDQTKPGEERKRRRFQNYVILSYHIFSLVSLVLSLNVIITATATSNSLMFGVADPMARSIYHFLAREFPFEFLVTQWSFYTGVFSFLGSILTRCLIEFKLMQPGRRRAASVIVFGISSLAFHSLSLVNRKFGESSDNLASMTTNLFKMYFARVLSRPSLCEMLSFLSFVGSVIAAIALFVRAEEVSKDDHSVDNIFSR